VSKRSLDNTYQPESLARPGISAWEPLREPIFRALAWALEFARTFDAALVLLNVIGVHKSYGAVKGGFIGRLRASAGKELRNMVEALPMQKSKGVALVEKVTVFPRAWSGIVKFVRDQDIDVIVMSTMREIVMSTMREIVMSTMREKEWPSCF